MLWLEEFVYQRLANWREDRLGIIRRWIAGRTGDEVADGGASTFDLLKDYPGSPVNDSYIIFCGHKEECLSLLHTVDCIPQKE